MPCVCLSNTFRKWQALRAIKLQERQSRSSTLRSSALHPSALHTTAVQPVASPTSAPSRTDTTILRIPHSRSNLSTSSATVSQTLTAAISTRLRQTSRSNNSAFQFHIAHAPKAQPNVPTNVLNFEPICPEDLQPGATRADLINAESRLGSAIFGPIPAGHRREFFHDRQNIWIWHEDWQDQTEQLHQMTVRYEVRTSGVYKKISTGKYLRLEGDELENFRRATHAYLYLVKKYLYKTPTVATAQA